MRIASLCLSLWVMVVVAGCAEWRAPRAGLTEEDEALLAAMVLRSPPVDPNNPDLERDDVAVFGQQLFFDQGLSFVDGGVGVDGGPPTFAVPTAGVSCADCHSPRTWFSDERPARNVSLGLSWTLRNSPSMVNVAFYETWGWDGRADALWAQAVHAYQAPATMAGTALRAARVLQRRYADRYLALYREPLPPELAPDHPQASRFEPPPGVALTPDAQAELDRIYDRFLKALAVYMSRLISRDAPFDRFAEGDELALTPAARRGLGLFLGKAGCIECHRGPAFTDNRFHVVGIGQSGPNVRADVGRELGLAELKRLRFRASSVVPEPSEADRGAFRTKSLRQVAMTAPYMHAGQLATLKDVVWFYNRGGDRDGAGTPSRFMVPLGLSEDEQSDLVLFLEALTGAPVEPRWACDNARETAPGMRRPFPACAGAPP
jgi:cytochrome c peroxidase